MARNQFIFCDTRIGVIAALFFAIFTVNPVLAQTESSASKDEWQHAIAIYGWGASIGGHTASGSGFDVSFDDLLDNL